MALDKLDDDHLKKFWGLIDDNPTCMMVSVDSATGLHGRPMHAVPDADAGEIWFYTRLSSGKSEELAKDGEVCLSFSDPRASDYVSVTGQASLSTDKAKIKAHWNRFVDAWFPEGPDGADVGMIRVKAERGEYWDGDSSSVLAAIKMLVASERDETPDLGENRKVAL